MVVLPPGTILQILYLKERLRRLRAGRFIEIGPGSGEITRRLLEAGWTGHAFDLDATTTAALRERFAPYVANGRLAVRSRDFVTCDSPPQADLVISCMVMEHMDDERQGAFVDRSARCLAKRGLMIGLVPASPAHWGIEDDIAGHYRRYTRESLAKMLRERKWELAHAAGLTYPLSNMLLPVSNYLVRRTEASKLSLSALERTKLSGRRQVAFKTHFPPLAALLLNEMTIWPLHVMQKLFSSSEGALVLYFEARPPSSA